MKGLFAISLMLSVPDCFAAVISDKTMHELIVEQQRSVLFNSRKLEDGGRGGGTCSTGCLAKCLAKYEVDPCNKPFVTESPSNTPTESPTETPTVTHSSSPTEEPTNNPTEEPTAFPSGRPTPVFSVHPTESRAPTPRPTEKPTKEPTPEPTKSPTRNPTPYPTTPPTPMPTTAADGTHCHSNAICTSRYCNPSRNQCWSRRSDGNSCSYNHDCTSGYCNSGTLKCGKSSDRTHCHVSTDCRSNYCNSYDQTCGKFNDNHGCHAHGQCKANYCTYTNSYRHHNGPHSTCGKKNNGYHCHHGSDCRSNRCCGTKCKSGDKCRRRMMESSPMSMDDLFDMTTGNGCMEQPYELSLVNTGDFHFGLLAESTCGGSEKNCDCAAHFFHAKESKFDENDQDGPDFLEKEILKVSQEDLDETTNRFPLGTFPLTEAVNAFYKADIDDKKVFDLTTFNCGTLLVKMLNELNVNVADDELIQFVAGSFADHDEKTSKFVKTLREAEVKSRLETEFGLKVVDNIEEEHAILEEYISTYINNHI